MWYRYRLSAKFIISIVNIRVFRQYLRMCIRSAIRSAHLHYEAVERQFLLGARVFTPVYSHVKQALRNEVVHALSKVLR